MADVEPEDDPVELTVRRMAELHSAHNEAQSRLQRSVSRLTRSLSQPLAVAVALLVVLVWIGVNALAGRRGWDAPPYALLELVATVAAFITTLMILATQAREEEAARHRSQLTLQLASLSEQKIAKVIALLEEQRRDSPQLASRPDREAEEMSKPADPGHVLDRIKDTHEDC